MMHLLRALTFDSTHTPHLEVHQIPKPPLGASLLDSGVRGHFFTCCVSDATVSSLPVVCIISWRYPSTLLPQYFSGSLTEGQGHTFSQQRRVVDYRQQLMQVSTGGSVFEPFCLLIYADAELLLPSTLIKPLVFLSSTRKSQRLSSMAHFNPFIIH